MADEKSNIDEELEIIKHGTRGEDVRDAIKNAIKKIYNVREYPPTAVEFTANGTYFASNYPWDKVTVNVPDGGVSVANIDNCNTITDNGYYNIKKLIELGLVANPNCIGINGFLVDIPQVTGELGEITITENGEYDPLLDGYDGYSKVYVNVLGGEVKSYYTVNFYDGNTFLGSVKTPYGGNANYYSLEKDLPNSGGVFTGWNPNPVSVNRDMNCYAVYAGQGPTGSGKYIESISDSWETINNKIKNGSRDYQPGATKMLELKVPGAGSYILNMMLVGYNLDVNKNGGYAASTWVNIVDDIRFAGANASHPFGNFSYIGVCEQPEIYTACNGEMIWWKNSLTRALCNGSSTDIAFRSPSPNQPLTDLAYYNAMAGIHATVPELISAAAGFDLYSQMVTVVKYSTYNKISFDMTDPSNPAGTQMLLTDRITYDKIFLPSIREISYPPQVPASAYPPNGCTTGVSYNNPNAIGTFCYSLYENHINLATRDNYSYTPAIYGHQSLQSGSLHEGGYIQCNQHGYDELMFDGQGYTSFLPIAFCL